MAAAAAAAEAAERAQAGGGWALALGGAYLLKGAAAAAGADADRRTALARYFFGREFPALDALCEAAMDGAAPLYALSAEELAS